MSTRMVRVADATHERIRRIAEERNESIADVVNHAIEVYDRESLVEAMAASFARLGAVDDYAHEVAALDGTLLDGLDEAEYVVGREASAGVARGRRR